MEESTKRTRLAAAYEAYADEVYRVLTRYIGEEERAQDAVQEAFLRYYEEMDKVDIYLVEAWIIRVAKNIAYSMKRREACVLETDQKFHEARKKAEVQSAEADFLERQTCKEMRELRKNIFERLQEENSLWYETLMMVFIMQIPQKEVARRLGVHENVIYSRMKRARDWIKRNYGEEFEEQLGEKEKGAS